MLAAVVAVQLLMVRQEALVALAAAVTAVRQEILVLLAQSILAAVAVAVITLKWAAQVVQEL
jgi:hypothetical protein